MKKVFKLTALLLLVGALVMGCKGDAGEKLPGNWTKETTYYTVNSWVMGSGPDYV